MLGLALDELSALLVGVHMARNRVLVGVTGDRLYPSGGQSPHTVRGDPNLGWVRKDYVIKRSEQE